MAVEKVCGLDIVMINAWHPFDNNAYKNPLCYLDWTSTNLNTDAIPYLYSSNPTYKRNKRDPRSPELTPALGALHNPAHKWWFLPDMEPSRTLLFKQWDTRDAVAKCTFHTSFRDGFHDHWAECPPRRSIEMRLMALVARERQGGGGGESRL